MLVQLSDLVGSSVCEEIRIVSALLQVEVLYAVEHKEKIRNTTTE